VVPGARADVEHDPGLVCRGDLRERVGERSEVTAVEDSGPRGDHRGVVTGRGAASRR
jgi:hypothetical protein